MRKIPYGPTYAEMLNPHTIDPTVRRRALDASDDEFNPLNLFNITWKNADNAVNKIVLPSALTGVDATIVVLLGKDFPSGSHKVGPAYATLIEGCVDGDIVPGKHTILGPSTGNFGIGVSYICNLMKYDAIVIMPDTMSKERYDRIKHYGAELELTPGTESDVILTLEKTHDMVKKNKHHRALAQFELMPNYRFHRHVTGHSAIEAVRGIGNERIALFASAPGSAGTLAAGDAIKEAFPEARVAALEPYECSTLTDGGRGQHRIEGIGDKMCTLIHNVLTTDFLVLVEDEASVRGLKVLRDGQSVLAKHGIDEAMFHRMRDLFGVSGICNILGAIKMAKHLKLGPDDNVVTVATDGFDRYDSVLDDLNKRSLETSDYVLERWFKDVFMQADTRHITDVRHPEAKARLFKQKEDDWLKFGYSQAYLDQMKTMQFWHEEYAKIHTYNETIMQQRKDDSQ